MSERQKEKEVERLQKAPVGKVIFSSPSNRNNHSLIVKLLEIAGVSYKVAVRKPYPGARYGKVAYYKK